MARYVLVEFDDNAKAKAFVERVNGTYAAIDMPARGFRVKAIFGKPTLFCECSGGRRDGHPFTRGAKSGWWVCAWCGRPTKLWAEGRHWWSAIGRNLLPGNDDYVPRGWGTTPTQSDYDRANILPLGEGQVPAAITGEKLRKRKQRTRRY